MNKAGGIKLTTVALAVFIMAVSALINTSVADDQKAKPQAEVKK
ncbi:hypothetical protein N7931_04645 [Catenovulum sp. 2E275]|nr:hypothetical protein [Catenovulum sp. 2E275]MCU4674916.1 hypothetical protein [Catenovulum sp. 2E275]